MILRCLAVEPDPHHGAVQDQPHDRLLGERAGVPSLPVGLHLPTPPGSPCPCRPHCRTAPRALGGPGASTTPATLPSHTCKIHFQETMFALSNCSRRFISCVGSLTPSM